MNGLALQAQQALGRDPHAGDLYVFRRACGKLINIIWHILGDRRPPAELRQVDSAA